MQPIANVTMPDRIARRPQDARGFPIPWNVLIDRDGVPQFAINDHHRTAEALYRMLCPICGETLERTMWFVGGPKSAFHKDGVFLDQPMHLECVEYALAVCPYLAAKNYKHKEKKEMPEGYLGVDYTQDPNRPPVFVLMEAIDYEAIPRRTALDPIYLKPLGVVSIRYWNKGQRISEEEGKRLAQEALNG
jgi:hypothetical protein